jgi:cell division protein FtsA
VALKIPHKEAERIKLFHGSVLAEKLNQSSHISVQGLVGMPTREVQLSEVAAVLGARAEEIFDVINDVIKTQNLDLEITGGFVLTGGGALIKGLPELAEYILEKPVKIGYPIPFGGMTNVMQNPAFSTVLGLMLEQADKLQLPEAHEKNIKSSYSNNDIISKLGESLKSVFKEIF